MSHQSESSYLSFYIIIWQFATFFQLGFTGLKKTQFSPSALNKPQISRNLVQSNLELFVEC